MAIPDIPPALEGKTLGEILYAAGGDPVARRFEAEMQREAARRDDADRKSNNMVRPNRHGVEREVSEAIGALAAQRQRERDEERAQITATAAGLAEVQRILVQQGEDQDTQFRTNLRWTKLAGITGVIGVILAVALK